MKKLVLAILPLCFLAFSAPSYSVDSAVSDPVSATNVDTSSVNINEADAEQLAAALVGVGESKAKAIVDYRNEHGAFSSAAALTNVKGIGDATVAANVGNIEL